MGIKSIDEAIISEARVERDADGKIIRVHHSTSGIFNPLNDPLRELDSDSEKDEDDKQQQRQDEDQHGAKWEEWAGIEDDGDTEVVKSLVRQSRMPGIKRERHQSEGEREWLEKLTARWGDDYAAMAKDKRLNPMQQTAADIKRRLNKMK